MMNTLKDEVEQKRGKFEHILKMAKDFAEYIQLELHKDGLDIELEQQLPEKRMRVAKRQPGEITADEARSIARTPNKLYEIEVFNVILDTSLEQIIRRFNANQELMNDIALLDPRGFGQMKQKQIGNNMLSKIAELAKVDKFDLQRQLQQFAVHYEDYNCGIGMIGRNASYATNNTDLNGGQSDNDERELTYHCHNKTKCYQCLVCAVDLLCDLNSYGPIFQSLYTAYKFILTLSCTQVSCERMFSVLKVIKNRLRSSLGQELLEDFMLFYVERDFPYNYETAIDSIASSSSELSGCLKL